MAKGHGSAGGVGPTVGGGTITGPVCSVVAGRSDAVRESTT
jgi:hypothetical protein